MSTPASSSAAPFSLYVHRVSTNFTEYRQYNETPSGYTGRPTPCAAACDGRMANDCVPDYRYLPGNTCFRGARNTSWMFRQLPPSDNATEVQFFEQCAFGDTDCRTPPLDCLKTKLDVCGATSGEIYQELANWCIVSSAPEGEFTLPFATLRQYSALNWKEQDIFECASQAFREAFMPVDPQMCSVGLVRRGNEMALGSKFRYCSQTDFFQDNFADETCTGPPPTDLYKPRWHVTNEMCTTLEHDTVYVYVEDCDAPTWYCKDVVGVLPGLSRRISNDSPTPAPASTSPTTATSDTPTPKSTITWMVFPGIGLAAMVVVCCMLL